MPSDHDLLIAIQENLKNLRRDVSAIIDKNGAAFRTFSENQSHYQSTLARMEEQLRGLVDDIASFKVRCKENRESCAVKSDMLSEKKSEEREEKRWDLEKVAMWGTLVGTLILVILSDIF